ncbi:unnamed protein product [Commensalibacter communis]|nr:unnamed protein product [Commensalibacter communis]CAI3957364.1 unnamed protein product [Commensalibacter communis]CAI3958995.1 unnamed protein product [Commensalibacter communis]
MHRCKKKGGTDNITMLNINKQILSIGEFLLRTGFLLRCTWPNMAYILVEHKTNKRKPLSSI